MRPHRVTLTTLVLASALGCSGASLPAGGRDTLRPLERVRAQQVIEEALTARGLRAELGRRIRIAGRHEVECDVAIAGTRNCIEYTSAAERTRYGSAIPAHTNPDALVVVAGAEGDAGGHVLFLDDRDFLYEPDPERAGPGRPSVGEVLDRMRRTVTDYAVWLRERGGR